MIRIHTCLSTGPLVRVLLGLQITVLKLLTMEVGPLKLLGHYLISLMNQIIPLHKLLMRLVTITMIIPWMSWRHILSLLRWYQTLIWVQLCFSRTSGVVLPLNGSGLTFILRLSVVTSSRRSRLFVRRRLLLRWHVGLSCCEWWFAALHVWNVYLLRRCCLEQRL